MKKFLFVFAVLPLLFSCGGNTGTKKVEEKAKVEEVEVVEEVVEDSLSSEIESSIEEIKEETEEVLQEVDSLLEEL